MLRHARSIGADVVFLETCYLPEPETIDAAMLADAGPDLAGRLLVGPPVAVGSASTGSTAAASYGAERELVRWIDAAARLGHDVLRITGGQPGVARRRAGGGPRGAARRPDAPGRRLRRGRGVSASRWRTTATCASRDILDAVRAGGPTATPWASAWTTSTCIRVGDDMAEGTRALAPLHPARPAQGPRRRATRRSRADRSAPPSARAWPTSTASSRSWPPPASTVRSASSSRRSDPDDVDELAMVERSVDWLRAHLPGARG